MYVIKWPKSLVNRHFDTQAKTINRNESAYGLFNRVAIKRIEIVAGIMLILHVWHHYWSNIICQWTFKYNLSFTHIFIKFINLKKLSGAWFNFQWCYDWMAFLLLHCLTTFNICNTRTRIIHHFVNNLSPSLIYSHHIYTLYLLYVFLDSH